MCGCRGVLDFVVQCVDPEFVGPCSIWRTDASSSHRRMQDDIERVLCPRFSAETDETPRFPRFEPKTSRVGFYD